MNSTITSSGASSGLDTQGSPPTPPPLPPAAPASGQGGQEPMDSDSVGGEEDGGGRRHNVVDVEDDDARMDLTDDLLHKVRFSLRRDTYGKYIMEALSNMEIANTNLFVKELIKV